MEQIAADAVSRVGWRLTLEPMGERTAWSLFRRTRGEHGRSIPELAGAGVLPAGPAARALLAQLVPSKESSPWSCGLADSQSERSAAVELGRWLLPAALRDELLTGGPVRHTVTIATRGWLSVVPWDAVALDSTGDVRLIERAHIWGGLSPTVFAGRDRKLGSASTRRLAVVDPGPVGGPDELVPLYPGGYPDVLEDRVDDGRLDHLGPGWDPMSVDDFGDLLRDPSGWRSLCYLGHVRRGEATAAGAAGLLFQCEGRPQLLTARRWIAEPRRWPAPPWVCLLGCASDDSLTVEQSGLPMAALKAGAEVVTSTRWTLPSDRIPGLAIGTTELAAAMVDALAAEHPEVAIRAWQLDRLTRWRSDGDLEATPLLWASLITYRAPESMRSTTAGRDGEGHVSER